LLNSRGGRDLARWVLAEARDGRIRAAEFVHAALTTLREAERALALAGKSQRRLAQRARLAAELVAKALDALQSDTDQTLRAHVHSFRRAFATGLAVAGVNEQQAMRLAGHSNSATHKRYVKFGQRAALVTPAAALPRKPGQKRQKSKA
jgi:site-specific recombinase XerD